MSKSPTDALLSCVTCGGPLPLGSETCRYCNAKYDKDLSRIKYTKSSVPCSSRSCPKCETPMETLSILESETFNIERCSGCLGIFFDTRELEELLSLYASSLLQADKRRINEILIENPDSETKIVYLDCPVCETKMQRKNFGYKTGVVFDTCVSHGAWLDSGKLATLIRWAELGGMDVVCPLEKERARLKREKEEFEAKIKLENRNSGSDF